MFTTRTRRIYLLARMVEQHGSEFELGTVIGDVDTRGHAGWDGRLVALGQRRTCQRTYHGNVSSSLLRLQEVRTCRYVLVMLIGHFCALVRIEWSRVVACAWASFLSHDDHWSSASHHVHMPPCHAFHFTLCSQGGFIELLCPDGMSLEQREAGYTVSTLPNYGGTGLDRIIIVGGDEQVGAQHSMACIRARAQAATCHVLSLPTGFPNRLLLACWYPTSLAVALRPFCRTRTCGCRTTAASCGSASTRPRSGCRGGCEQGRRDIVLLLLLVLGQAWGLTRASIGINCIHQLHRTVTVSTSLTYSCNCDRTPLLHAGSTRGWSPRPGQLTTRQVRAKERDADAVHICIVCIALHVLRRVLLW